jgi:hypothetical protein
MAQIDMPRAAGDLERAVGSIKNEADTDSLYARYFLGLCYEKGGEIDKAAAQWEQVYAQKKGFKDVGEKLSRYMLNKTTAQTISP